MPDETTGVHNPNPTTITPGPGNPTRTAGGTTGPLDSSQPASPGPVPAGVSRYAFVSELAHGGMGVVYEARDAGLNRDVAVKVLHGRFAVDGPVAGRFVTEAQITGQLQHPGIPAVHDLGTLPDGRPFLAMKLIRGQTLDALLKARPDPAADRGRFVGVFEHICQAVAYAHSRNVIHRDLKPANVMVGAFGEVQVMDWGLAKVLGEPGTATAADSGESDTPPEVVTDREHVGETSAGSVLGTPAYMPPEQAAGATDQVDARSDVFGLGAILCAILTGKPPFVGVGGESTRRLAAAGNLTDAFARLDGCGAEPDLVGLCRRCLSPDRVDRPADASEVAGAVATLRAEADERARQAELERVRVDGERSKAELQAAESRKRRRVLLGLAWATLVAALATVGLVVGGVYNARLNSAYEAETVARSDAESARAKAELARQAEETQRVRAEAAKVEEEIQRKRAEAAKGEEEAQRKLAVQARRSAEAARDALDRALNLTKVFVAASFIQDQDLAQALERLGECEAELRGWDWYYLNARCHPELYSVPHPNPNGRSTPVFTPDGNHLILDDRDGTPTARDAWTGEEAELPGAVAGLAGPLAFSPDGSRVAGLVPRPSGPHLLGVLGRMVQPPQPLAPTPLPALAAARDALEATGTRVRVHDTRTGREVASFFVRGTVTKLEFTPDGQRVCFQGRQGLIHVHDAATGAEAFPPVQGTQYWGFNPDGSRMAVSGGGGAQAKVVTIYDTGTGKVVDRFDVPELVFSPTFTPDGTRLVGSCPSGLVRVFALPGGEEVRAFKTAVRLPVLVLSPDGNRLATAPWSEGEVQVFDLEKGEEVRGLQLPDYANSLPAFSPDGTRLAATGPDGVLHLYDVLTDTEVDRIAAPALLSKPVFTPDATRVAAAGSDGRVRVYDARVVAPGATFPGTLPESRPRLVPAALTFPTGQYDGSALSADGTALLLQVHRPKDRLDFVGVPWDVWRVDLATGRQKQLFTVPPAYRAVFGPDATRIAVTVDPAPSSEAATKGLDVGTNLHDGETGRGLVKLKGRVFPSRSTFSPDGSRVQTITPDGSVCVYDARTGKALCTIPPSPIRKAGAGYQKERPADPDRLLTPANEWSREEWNRPGKIPLEFSPDGGLLAELGPEGIQLYDTRTGRPTVKMSPDEGRLVHRFGFSPAGHVLAAGSTDGSIQLFDVRSGANVGAVGGAGKLYLLGFSPDGSRLVASGDGAIRVFDAVTLLEAYAVPVPLVRGRYLYGGSTFTPDGERFVVCGDGGSLRMFDARTGQETYAPDLPGGRAVKSGILLPDNLEFSRDGAWLVFRGPDGVHLWAAPRDLAAHQARRRDQLRAYTPNWHLGQLDQFRRADYPAGMAFHAARLSDLQPGNPAFHAFHGLSLKKLGREADARRAFLAALGRKAALPPQVRATVHAELGQWEEATEAFAPGLAARDANPTDWYAFAVLKLRQGEKAEYPKLCAEALRRYTRVQNPQAALSLVSLCTLAPAAVDQYDQLVGVARSVVKASPQQPVPRATLGAILYRAGKFEEAAAELTRADELSKADRPITNCLFLAMAYHRLGRFDEAEVWLRNADRAASARPPRDWVLQSEHAILRGEAERLITGRIAPAPRPSK